MKQPSVNIKNKRATFDYELMDTTTLLKPFTDRTYRTVIGCQ